MAHQSDLIAQDIHAYLKHQEEKTMLRFITCGSVDDGKSTLIGRLLWDSKMIFEDQLEGLQNDSKKSGTQGENIDYALLLDGLQAEREQGITIDVAYRFFSTDKRKFIVADTPGHEQYTRNMVTGASTAQVAVILIDARKGILTQTRRHSYLSSLVGIRHIVLAINKMDLIDYNRSQFESIRDEYLAFAENLGFESITPIPLSALEGDNILKPSSNTSWYEGQTLMRYLETIQVDKDASQQPFRMRVQWVNRPNLDFRGFCGNIASGTVQPGDELVVSSSGKKSRVARIVTMDGDLPQAVAGQAVTLCFEDEIDISRGDLLSTIQDRPHYVDHVKAQLVWLHEEAMHPGRSYLLKAGATSVPVQIDKVNNKVNVNTLKEEPSNLLHMNEVGLCTISTNAPLPIDRYSENRATGSFIVIDRFTNATVAAGMIVQPLKHTASNHWQSLKIDKLAHAALKQQTPKVVWLSGQPETGQKKIASLIEKKLHSLGKHTYILDRDKLNNSLNRDLSDDNSTETERVRRTAETARILVDAGLIAIVPATTSCRDEFDYIRQSFATDEFVEIQLDPLTNPEQQADSVEEDINKASSIPIYHFSDATRSPDEIALALVKDLFEYNDQTA